MSSLQKSTFADFCEAWGSRFPGSELPAAWEEDVRANLKKHKTKVSILREELEKEEMYVEYLDKLLADIERHRKSTCEDDNNDEAFSEPTVAPLRKPTAKERSSLQLTLESVASELSLRKTNSVPPPTTDIPNGDSISQFVTVINVPAPEGKETNGDQPALQQGSNLTYTKSKEGKKVPPPKPPKRHTSRESLNSVSSPTTPTSTEDFNATAGEGLVLSPGLKSSSGSEELVAESPKPDTLEKGFKQRGQPDGRDNEGSLSRNDASMSRGSKIKALMESWENKQQSRTSTSSSPETSRAATRKDSDSSSRGRMGSPGGKSHDSSDSETSNNFNRSSPRSSRRVSGETRLDRLVRRPSGDRSRSDPPPPALPKPNKKPIAKPRTLPSIGQAEISEPLYDTVANEEPEDEYDNHLLYGTNKSDKSLGSADLGFDEPPSAMKSAQSGLSLTSSDTDVLSHSSTPPYRRGLSMEEEESNYVNIQYFLMSKKGRSDSTTTNPMDTIQSDDELDDTTETTTLPVRPAKPDPEQPKSDEAERILMYKCILNSILDSEAIYLEGLSVMLQYMKAMKVTLVTSQPVIPKEDFDVIFYKIPELHDLHLTFYESLKKQVERWNGHDSIGHTFKMLASRTKIYAAYLNNYQKALEALHRCNEQFPQFADLTRSIKLRTVKGQKQGQSLSLDDLLHKPVARVQKHSLCLQDLIKYTPEDHEDFVSLNQALSTVQTFLNEYNMMHAGELFPHHERHQRHLVKNSFIVEISDGSRKLRHLFLFNDVLVCAKYKASGGKNEKFTFQLKWYIPLCHCLIVEDPSTEPKESNPPNLVSLKTQTASLRDQILRIEKEEEWKSGSRRGTTGSASGHGHSKASEKHRKKLAEIEAQLVLAAPNLLFQVSHKQGKTYSFFLSSEYERSQWVETLQVLQTSLPPNPTQAAKSMSMYELQAWITSCRKFLKTNMGSFLMRSPRDEALLVGDLHFEVERLQGLTRPADLFVVVEVDSYGHYFKKSKTKMICGTIEPVWNEEFIIELEGSENLRILVYEQQPQGNMLRGRATLELSRSWLTNKAAEQMISMNDVVLTCKMKFVTFEETIRRVPNAKPAGLFGAPIQTLTKKEKRAVPFIVTSCVREVERRGVGEVGIYRVSGSAADVTRLKKAYETNPYEAEQLLKECDIHSVAGVLKQFLRDLPESLFTTAIYQQMFDAYQMQDQEQRKHAYLSLFAQIPQNPNQACIVFLIEHMVRVSQLEQTNKMSLHNLATVFGPTMLNAGNERDKKGSKDHALTLGTVDVMAQAGILHFFLTRRARGEPIQIVERQV